jgi:hypothetical protein
VTSLCALGTGMAGVCCFIDQPCVDPRNDPMNCGGCNVRCPSSQTCVLGVCSDEGSPCGAGHLYEFCGGGTGSICCPGSGCVAVTSAADCPG